MANLNISLILFQDVDEFLESVREYVDKPASSREEEAFRESVMGYLELIDNNSSTNHISSKNCSNAVGKIPVDAIEAFEAGDNGPKEEAQERRNIGKIDIDNFIHCNKSSNTSVKDSSHISRDSCQQIKSMLEQNQISRDESVQLLKNYSKKRLIDIPDTCDERFQRKEGNERNWKWKQKKVEELYKFVRQDKIGKEIIIDGTDNKVVDISPNVALLNLKATELARSMEQKDREFNELMGELEEVVGAFDSGSQHQRGKVKG